MDADFPPYPEATSFSKYKGSLVLPVFPPLLLKCFLSLTCGGSAVSVPVVILQPVVSGCLHVDQLWLFVTVPICVKISMLAEGESCTYLCLEREIF